MAANSLNIDNGLGFLVSSNTISKKTWIITSILYLLHGLMAWIFQAIANTDDWWLHGLWCVSGVIIAAPIFRQTFIKGVALALIDHKVMLTAAFVLYFLIGASLMVFGSQNNIDEVMGYYPVNAIDVLRVDGFNSVGLAIALFTATALKGEWFLGGARNVAKQAAQLPVHVVLLVLFSFGLLGYMFATARDLGIIHLVIPGAVGQLSNLLLFCVFLGAAFKGKVSNFIHFLCVATVFIMIIVGLISFNKSSIYLPIMAFCGGLAIRRSSGRYVLIGIFVVLVTLSAIGDLVSYGRNIRDLSGAPVSERIEVIKDYLSGSRIDDSRQYSGWSRLCYTPSQVAALDFYDEGSGGSGVKLIPWLFVPRFFASNKPIITGSGNEFNYKIAGSYLSATGMGVFVSGYYNEGWLGFVFASIFCGWFLAQTSALSKLLIKENALILLPLGLLGLFAAYRIDGEIIADYMGAFVIILYPLIALVLVFGVKLRND